MYRAVRYFRLRAGFYITHDGEYRIVRRKVGHFPRMVWCVERWSAGELRWERLTERWTLALARDYVDVETSLRHGGE